MFAITGATSSTYTTPVTKSSDNAVQFSVVVSNPTGTVASNSAVLTISAAQTLLLNSSSTTISFGSVAVSTDSGQNIALTNAGTANVTISQVSVAGAGFTASGINGLILIPGQSAAITATFAPSANGSATGSITVSGNASNSPSVISLTGTGVASVTHSVVLSWVGGATGIIGYRAYSSTVSGGPYTSLTSSSFTSPNYTDSTVQSGQTYYYVVTAIGSQNQESTHSAEVVAVIR